MLRSLLLLVLLPVSASAQVALSGTVTKDVDAAGESVLFVKVDEDALDVWNQTCQRMNLNAMDFAQMRDQERGRLLVAGDQSALEAFEIETDSIFQAEQANRWRTITGTLASLASARATIRQGAFRIDSLLPGTYLVFLRIPAEPRPYLWAIAVDLDAGESTRLDLDLDNQTPSFSCHSALIPGSGPGPGIGR